MNAMKQEAPEREEIEALLPWHAAGTLSRRDAQRVEEALARDPELARRYALVREELGETIHLNETLGAPSARALENLFAKIDAEPERQPTPSLNLGSRIGAEHRSRRGRVHPDPVCTAGDVRRHQQIPRGQQAVDRCRPDGRRTL